MRAWVRPGREAETEFPLRDDQRSCLVGIDLDTQKLLFDRILPGAAGLGIRVGAAGQRVATVCQSAATRSGQCPGQGRVLRRGDRTPGLGARDRRGDAIGDVLFELANSPLSLADDTLYYNTNLGAVVALRAE